MTRLGVGIPGQALAPIAESKPLRCALLRAKENGIIRRLLASRLTSALTFFVPGHALLKESGEVLLTTADAVLVRAILAAARALVSLLTSTDIVDALTRFEALQRECVEGQTQVVELGSAVATLAAQLHAKDCDVEAVHAQLRSKELELHRIQEDLRASHLERDGLRRELDCVSESRREIEGKLAALLSGSREHESRSVTNLRQENEALHRNVEELQLQLADVHNFMDSERGSTLRNMELALAHARLQLAQAEEEKDELEMRLTEHCE